MKTMLCLGDWSPIMNDGQIDPVVYWAAWIIGCALVFAIIGSIIGYTKNNSEGGFFLGLLLGPIGWIIVLMIHDPTLKLCPECQGKCPPAAKRCQHCGVEFKPAVGV